MSTASVTRWAGAVVAVCALVFTITALLYLTAYGQPAGTGADGAITLADRADHLLDRWGFISALWLVEAITWVLMAIAAFVLQRRPQPGRAWLPAPVGWTAVGVGAVVTSLMYAFMLGGYPAAIEAMPTSGALLDAMNGGATVLFYLGGAAVFFGFAGVLLGEASPTGVIPRWLALGGAIVCLAEAAIFLLLLAGVGEMRMAGPGGLLGTLAVAYTAFSISRTAAE